MKTSRKSLYRIAIVLILAKISFGNSSLHAQVEGLYLTVNDFTNNKLSFAKTEDKKCKIRIHSYSFRTSIKVICNDSTYYFSKDSVFGYKEEELICRFYKKETYILINPNESILIYKIPIASKTKYEETFYNYYFSKTPGGPVFSLTIRNLESCFEDNKHFIELVDVHFRDNNELREYDYNHKVYKINRLLELSKTKTN